MTSRAAVKIFLFQREPQHIDDMGSNSHEESKGLLRDVIDRGSSNDVRSEIIWSSQQVARGASNQSMGSMSSTLRTAFIAGFIISLTTNAVFFLSVGRMMDAQSQLHACHEGRSQYSELPRNVSKELPYHSPYWSGNETVATTLWNAIPIHTGFVALGKQWTDLQALPRGDSFPWDDSKTVYVLNVYHILHCLQMFRTSILEAHQNIPQSIRYRHLQHCLNDLREDAMCNADDTPRYTHPWPDHVTGADGQLRRCRDFDALSSWAKANTACFRFSHRDDPAWNRTARFRNCPPESPYLPLIRDTYGFTGDWLPEQDSSLSW